MWNKIKFIFQKYVVIGINFVLQFFLFKRFDVQTAGMLNYGRTLFQYFEYSNIGLRNTIDRRTFKSPSSVAMLIRSARLINLLIAAAVAVVIFAFDRNYWTLFFLVSGVFYSYLFYEKVYLRNSYRIQEYVKLSFLFDLIPIVFLTIGIITGIFTLAGSLFLLSYLLLFIYFSVKGGLKNDVKYDKRYDTIVFNKNIKEGFYLFLSTFLYFVLLSGDRFFLKSLFGYAVVAQVSFAMFFFNAFSPLPAALIEIKLKPLLTTADRKEFISFFKYIFLMTVSFIAVLYVCSPFIIKTFFKNYLDISIFVNYYSLLLLPHVLFQITFLVFFRKGFQKVLFRLLLASVTFYLLLLFLMKSFMRVDQPLLLIFVAKVIVNVFMVLFVVVFLAKKGGFLSNRKIAKLV